MTTLEIRIDGCKKRIQKLHEKVTRNEAKIAKLKAKIESGKAEKTPNGRYYEEWDIETCEDDINRANKDLASEQKKLDEYNAKLQAEIDRDNSIPNVPAVEEFLARWRSSADEYYRNEVQALRQWKEEYHIYYKAQRKVLEDEFGYEVHCFNKQVEAREKELKIDYKYERTYIANRWTAMVVYLSEYQNEFEQRLNKFLDDEVKARRIDLFKRCSEKVGVITNAAGLRTGANGIINGIVIGEEGKAEVETIYAGGYNIQCLHYRVLVKPIK